MERWAAPPGSPASRAVGPGPTVCSHPARYPCWEGRTRQAPRPGPRVLRVSVRAGIVVTGTEVLTGRVADRNGPWLADQLRVLGVDVGHIVVVGDRPDDVRSALEFLAGTGVSLVITSGGLGPTADDLTAQVVGDAQGRPSAVDPALE